DDLYRVCLASSIDLEAVLLTVAPGVKPLPADARVSWEALATALTNAGADTSTLDAEEVVAALDPSGRRLVAAAEVASGFADFQARHTAVLSQLADGLLPGWNSSRDGEEDLTESTLARLTKAARSSSAARVQIGTSEGWP
ncbi:unnamed protein product, partial [Polarella glacialis]